MSQFKHMGLTWKTETPGEYSTKYGSTFMEIMKTHSGEWCTIVEDKNQDNYDIKDAYKTRKEAAEGCMVISLFVSGQTLKQIKVNLGLTNTKIEKHLKRWL